MKFFPPYGSHLRGDAEVLIHTWHAEPRVRHLLAKDWFCTDAEKQFRDADTITWALLPPQTCDSWEYGLALFLIISETVSLCLVIAMHSDPFNKYLGVGSSANANSLLPAVFLCDFEEVVLCLILLTLCRIVLKQVPFPCYKYRKWVKRYMKNLGVFGVGCSSDCSMYRKACLIS